MFRCLVALFSHACTHACFGPRHERDIHNLHNRVTANRWGEDGSTVCAKATMVSLSSSSILISHQPTSTKTFLPDYKGITGKSQSLDYHTTLKFAITSSSCPGAPGLRQPSLLDTMS